MFKNVFKQLKHFAATFPLDCTFLYPYQCSCIVLPDVDGLGSLLFFIIWSNISDICFFKENNHNFTINKSIANVMKMNSRQSTHETSAYELSHVCFYFVIRRMMYDVCNLYVICMCMCALQYVRVHCARLAHGDSCYNGMEHDNCVSIIPIRFVCILVLIVHERIAWRINFRCVLQCLERFYLFLVLLSTACVGRLFIFNFNFEFLNNLHFVL